MPTLAAKLERLTRIEQHLGGPECGPSCRTCGEARQLLRDLGRVATALWGLQTEADCWCPPGWLDGGTGHTEACTATRRACGVPYGLGGIEGGPPPLGSRVEAGGAGR